MALSSPGVEVKVIDESFYTPAEPGTVPLIVVASAENKLNGSGTGIAAGTLKANADQVYLITSQRDLVETFGDPVFKTDASSNPIHAGELNEYGLQAAYSLLGVSNRAFVLRADLDLNQLEASAEAPAGAPSNGTYWLDTQNSQFGVFEWNGAPSTAGGQTFTNKVPLVLSGESQVNPNGTPKDSVGAIGDYAVVDSSNWSTLEFDMKLFYRAKIQDSSMWVEVGSNNWTQSWPTVQATNTVIGSSLLAGSIEINGTTINVVGGWTLDQLADQIDKTPINGDVAGIAGGAITATVIDNKLQILHAGSAGNGDDSASANSIVMVDGGQGILDQLGIDEATYYAPRLVISKHTQVPEFKLKDGTPRPTGSVWVKTTEPNLGAKWRVKRYNSAAGLWEDISAPIYATPEAALAGLDSVGGGSKLAIGTLFVQSNYDENFGLDDSPLSASFKVMRRMAVGETTIRSERITSSTFSGTYDFTIAETLAGSSTLEPAKTISFTATQSSTDAELLAAAITNAGFENINAEVDSLNRVIIKHKLGGNFRLADGTNTPLNSMGLTPYNFVSKTGTANLLAAPAGDETFDFVASLWAPLAYTASADAPSELATDGRLWYNSVVDEIDIMIHDGANWVGYKSATSPFYSATESAQTDPMGPIVSATIPELQSDGTDLVTGDLWIDTSSMDEYPAIYKFDADIPNKPIRARWVRIDTADQSTEEGIVFGDARYNVSGSESATAGLIVDLLESDYVDFDAPDPALYPKGMLLWNTRRSGFNVKEFMQNYVNTAEDNVRYGDESMDGYYPHRWVTASPNQEDGSGSFGRKAQRAVVVKALQAAVNTNQRIRDNESRIFNLMACPGYPELVGELVSLNYDRGLTAFVVADTPSRLTPDATSLLAWGTNERLAVEDNDDGLVTSDEYLGFFYPWGYTSDNFGNNVVVPPSHMMLRTIALNDQVAYPWFAPAGVRRGGVTNASAVGYVDGEGEFQTVALNEGQRDTLASVKVNPVTFITGTGLVNYGQYTRARSASALDRINVARLVVYLRRQLDQLAKPYVFEPNDKITRDEIKAAVEGLLLELVGQRALYDFLVVCDESNNTPARIDRNELYIDIAIEPVKAVEFIYIPLRLKNTGEIGG